MKPCAVFALQSPALLNIYAQSDVWDLEVWNSPGPQLVDDRLLHAPSYRGGPVECVFVCTEQQWFAAQALWPSAVRVWVAHNGKTMIAPPQCAAEHVLALSRRVARLHQQASPAAVHVVVPFYTPAPRWNWGPATWTLRNRPSTREGDVKESITATLACAGNPQHTFYGEGWEAGPLCGERRIAVEESCSAYVSCLPNYSGFGLAEHECLAAGIPVVGFPWGDMDEELPDYWCPDAQRAGAVLWSLCDPSQGPTIGRTMSETGLDFISKYRTKARMDHEIGVLLDALL